MLSRQTPNTQPPRSGRRPTALLLGILLGLAPALPAGAAGAASTAERIAPTAVRLPGTGGSEHPSEPWTWPVDGPRTVTASFRAPAHEYGPGHRGMDIAAPVTAVVLAPAAGVVAFRGTVVDRPLVTIDHGGLVSTWEPVESDLTPGDVVAAGTVIGAVATGGHAVPGTLHVGVRVDKQYVNPRPLFGEVPRAVLLPCCE